jgi:hypothetical protein
MSYSPSAILSIEDAITLLKSFSCMQVRILESVQEKQQLQQALKTVTEQIDHQNLGICANNSQEGLASLQSYLQALGYPEPKNSGDLTHSDRPVYIKCNTTQATYYMESYTGTYRGVLVSCQSENEALLGTFGHFPLDLYED